VGGEPASADAIGVLGDALWAAGRFVEAEFSYDKALTIDPNDARALHGRGRSLAARRRLPDYALVVPNLCNDMHDCPVATGDAWLRRHVQPLLASPALEGGVVFVVFDEGTSGASGGGAVEALALGPTVRRSTVFSAPTGHEGLLRTIEDAWHLPRLGGSATATPIGGIWK